jgi:hypothetical protein
MRVIGYYYESYPDDDPEDATFAATRMGVFLGEESDTLQHFQAHYTFQVYTFRYIQEEFFDRGKPVTGRSLLIVPTLASNWMKQFLGANADSLSKWGELE